MYDRRLRNNLPRVEERIRQALERAGRTDEVRIVAVTKGHPVDAVRAAVAAGLLDCGENRVPELAEKIEALGRAAARWHLIGHLQRNKVKKAIELFDLVHSIDTVRLAKELSAEGVARGMITAGLIQVNASGEVSKGGIDITRDDSARAIEIVQEIAELPNLEIRGLMTMAPLVDDTAVIRETFSRTRRLSEACAQRVPRFTGRDLSMGMSNDFEIAIEEGSTLTRLGTILFGERSQ